ncbi:Mitochondrial transcription termination factor family protein [Thalictrum thalictroides]|uniref:Mitochondrial transcription termination factor family protein n=1 Tax=Thalictrum thalictroides TaxID=46969 RepID=A0A7J6UYV0_THATH|nr:Mitochondrial transcription termination factor family protein [Thalictrum thalictroides]
MFRSLCNKLVLHTHTTCISFSNRNLTTTYLIRSISTSDTINHNTFTVSYLINSCGLSLQDAIFASKKVQFENPKNPDSVLTFLRNHGFDNTQISKFINNHPPLLLAKVDKTLKPKFDFFKTMGFSNPDLVKVLSSDPVILLYSLEKRIIPSCVLLKSIVQTDAKLISLIKRSAKILRCNQQKTLAPNIALLQNHGVPDSHIAMLLVTNPRSILQTFSCLNQKVEELKKMEIDPKESKFVRGISTLASMSKSTFQEKCDVYRSWGWSDDEIHVAFKKEPKCLEISPRKIMRNMEFFVNKMGVVSKSIAKHPLILMFSLEKRIFPRCSVIQLLISKGMVKKDYNFNTLLTISDEDFLKKFVTNFEDKFPEVVNAYQGKLNVL